MSVQVFTVPSLVWSSLVKHNKCMSPYNVQCVALVQVCLYCSLVFVHLCIYDLFTGLLY